MPRLLQPLALVLAFLVSGAPAWIGELVEDDCATECADTSGCPDEGCGDCSVVCSSCPRGHVLVPSLAAGVALATADFTWISSDVLERVPDDPVPEGVFHPPRLAAA